MLFVCRNEIFLENLQKNSSLAARLKIQILFGVRKYQIKLQLILCHQGVIHFISLSSVSQNLIASSKAGGDRAIRVAIERVSCFAREEKNRLRSDSVRNWLTQVTRRQVVLRGVHREERVGSQEVVHCDPSAANDARWSRQSSAQRSFQQPHAIVDDLRVCQLVKICESLADGERAYEVGERVDFVEVSDLDEPEN